MYFQKIVFGNFGFVTLSVLAICKFMLKIIKVVKTGFLRKNPKNPKSTNLQEGRQIQNLRILGHVSELCEQLLSHGSLIREHSLRVDWGCRVRGNRGLVLLSDGMFDAHTGICIEGVVHHVSTCLVKHCDQVTKNLGGQLELFLRGR